MASVTNHVKDLITSPHESQTHSERTSRSSFFDKIASRWSSSPAQLQRRFTEARRTKVIRAALKKRPYGYRNIQCLIQDTVIQILHYVASNLLTLSFSAPYDYAKRPNSSPIIPNFPLLTELTVSYLNSWPTSGVALLFGELDHFPSLKRLNLAGIEIRVPLMALFDAITVHSPCLSHLFLPIVHQSHATWAAFTCLLAFGTLQKVSSGLRDHDIPPGLSALTGPEKIPPWLEKIFVQEGLGAAVWLQVYKLIVHYEERFVFLPCQGDYDPMVLQRGELEKQWVDSINGGEGCWRTTGSLDRMSLIE